YEILAPLGAGGMGEVYRARDERLKRDVAIKVLPAELAADPERRGRFEREARSASALSHPNILTVFDIGAVDSTVYIAMEMVDGGTLKDLVASGPVPVRKLLELSTQIAEGLAAAHAAGIVHRDLKPANVMVSKNGYVKILDFGLAKLVTPEDKEVSALQTAAGDPTRPGMVMGTIGYMSPEQAAGRTVDFRSDQFSFGSILYEMATGKRAFERGTTAETMTAIIREEPDSVAQVNPKVPAPVRWILERCLAKDADDRFGTTKDLARDLASVRDHLSEAAVATTTDQTAAAAKAVRSKRRVWPWLLGAAALAGVFLAGRNTAPTPGPPAFKQLTFRRGAVSSARFAPDGSTIIYGAAWDGRPFEIYTSRPESPESRPFGLSGADVLSISPSGEMALSLTRHYVSVFAKSGTLARMSVAGGVAPREVQEDVQWADWSPDGANLAIVREAGIQSRLEYPIGKPLYETVGWISHPRVSPAGDLIAFLDHPIRGDDGGLVAVVDRSGKRRALSGTVASLQGLAWSPGGGEVWFTGALVGGNRALYAVSLSGKTRLLARVAGPLTILDVSRRGSVLMTHDTERYSCEGLSPTDRKERDLGWLDWSVTIDVSPDGRTLLFTEAGEGAGAGYSTYVRTMDGSPAVRLGEGTAAGLSPDARSVIAIVKIPDDPQIAIYPTGAGQPQLLARDGLKVQNAYWMPDGKRILMAASESGGQVRLYLRDVPVGKPKAISPPGYQLLSRTISADGKRVAVRGPDQRLYFYPIEGGEPTPIPGLTGEDTPVGWTADGRSLYAYRRSELPVKVYRVDAATGKRELWKELAPEDAAGVTQISRVCPTPDGTAYAYSYSRTLSDLYLVEGLK
ncbi:MAG: protein kinase, partial [Thermoanaerobaculia bacterium]